LIGSTQLHKGRDERSLLGRSVTDLSSAIQATFVSTDEDNTARAEKTGDRAVDHSVSGSSRPTMIHNLRSARCFQIR
jgi:hypothetical protein